MADSGSFLRVAGVQWSLITQLDLMPVTMISALLLRAQCAWLLQGHGHRRGPYNVFYQLSRLALSLDLELWCHELNCV